VLSWNFTEAPAPLRELDSSVSALDEIEALFSSDRDRDHAAWALVQVMQGEMGGFSSDQAQATALLYEGLHLPARPAAALLRSVRTPVEAKRQALRALRSRAHESEVKEATRTAVCALAGKVDGLLDLAGVSSSVEDAYLADDETDLLVAIAALYGTNEAEGLRILDYLTPGLSSANPVVRRLRTFLVGRDD
jgi:hypothetical protein